MPEKNNNSTSNKRRKKMSPMRRVMIILFAILICVMAYLVKQVMDHGIGLPVTGTGKIAKNPAQETQLQSQPTEPAESTEPTTEQPTETEPPALSDEEIATMYLKDLTLEEKIWQMIIVESADRFNADGSMRQVGGVYYAPESLTDAQQFTNDVASLHGSTDTPLLIGVSEEGGSIAPLSQLGLTDQLEPMQTYGDLGNAKAVYDLTFILAQQLTEAGVNFNLAPVADTINWYPDDVKDRSFSADVTVASEMVDQAVKGMQDGGAIACLKHFPNLGSSASDGTNDISWRPYSNFVEEDFLPFRAGIDAGVSMVLVSNMMVPDMTNGVYTPCCMSENVVTNILRNELGFRGVVISDTQENREDAQGYVGIIEAGCDLILMPADAQVAFDVILAAVKDGTLSEERIDESVYRILLLKCNYNIIDE